MSGDAEKLRALVGQVDVIDAAGRMIVNPVRASISRAEILALAIATEKLWEVCLEAELLARAVAIPETGNPIEDGLRSIAVDTQATIVLQLMAVLRPQSPKEQVDGTH